jgi:hypothetical protein
MANFAPAARTFPISPLNRQHPNRRTNPAFIGTVRNQRSNFVFAGFRAKSLFLPQIAGFDELDWR